MGWDRAGQAHVALGTIVGCDGVARLILHCLSWVLQAERQVPWGATQAETANMFSKLLILLAAYWLIFSPKPRVCSHTPGGSSTDQVDFAPAIKLDVAPSTGTGPPGGHSLNDICAWKARDISKWLSSIGLEKQQKWYIGGGGVPACYCQCSG